MLNKEYKVYVYNTFSGKYQKIEATKVFINSKFDLLN